MRTGKFHISLLSLFMDRYGQNPRLLGTKILSFNSTFDATLKTTTNSTFGQWLAYSQRSFGFHILRHLGGGLNPHTTNPHYLGVQMGLNPHSLLSQSSSISASTGISECLPDSYRIPVCLICLSKTSHSTCFVRASAGF